MTPTGTAPKMASICAMAMRRSMSAGSDGVAVIQVELLTRASRVSPAAYHHGQLGCTFGTLNLEIVSRQARRP